MLWTMPRIRDSQKCLRPLERKVRYRPCFHNITEVM